MVRQIAHITIPPREKRSATFRVFTSETTPEEETERGLLFGGFVINYYHHRNEEIIESIIEELQSRYYDPDIAAPEPEQLFEETLRSLNTTLAQLIENEQIFLNLKHFHAVVGVLRGKSLIFAHVGDFQAYLLHHNIAQRHRFIDLLASANGEEKKTPPITRIFSQLITGTIRTSDVAFFTTSNLFDYCTKERLEKTIATSSPTSAIEQIKSVVKTAKEGGGVLCLLLRLAPERERVDAGSPEQSLETLSETEEKTRRYLAPSLFHNGWKYAKWSLLQGEGLLKKLLRIPPGAPRKEIVTNSFSLALSVIRSFGRFLIFCKRTLAFLWAIGKGVAQQRGDWRAALATIKEQSQKRGSPVADLSLRQRVLIVATCVLGVVLLVSTTVLWVQRTRTQQKEMYEKNVALIKERIVTAEASRLFKDEERTTMIYGEAMKLIEELPKKTKEQRTLREELAKEVTQHLERLRHVVPLARVDMVKDFKELDPAVELSTFALSGTTAYVAHGGRPLLYKINLENKQILTLDAAQVDVRPMQRIASEEKGDALYLAFDTNGIATLNLERQSVAQTDITFGKEGVRVNDLTLYNKRLYLLDTANGQIWRHEKTKSGFGTGKAWLATPADLADARSLAIDGAVWVVKQDNVLRFLQGKQTNWQIGAIDPPGLALQKIILSAKGNTLWLLDAAGKRVLAIAKDSGKLLAQYPLPADDIRDFSINEKTGQILLLTKTKLLSLEYEKE